MPYPKGSADDIYYFSWNSGPVHFISLGSFYSGGFGTKSPMTVWLNKDFAAVNKTLTPWTVVMVHAPWYNSNKAHTNDGLTMRDAYESFFIENGVSIIVSGHVHANEVSLPVANAGQVVAPGEGMVHFNCGDGGAGLYTTWLTQPDWSFKRFAQWGMLFYKCFNTCVF
jgi:acid phosphatase type 7